MMPPQLPPEPPNHAITITVENEKPVTVFGFTLRLAGFSHKFSDSPDWSDETVALQIDSAHSSVTLGFRQSRRLEHGVETYTRSAFIHEGYHFQLVDLNYEYSVTFLMLPVTSTPMITPTESGKDSQAQEHADSPSLSSTNDLAPQQPAESATIVPGHNSFVNILSWLRRVYRFILHGGS